jgi:hypothetical protein
MSIIYRYGNHPIHDVGEQSSHSRRIHTPCDICDAANMTSQCDKCGCGVCDDNICRLNFPHRYNTTYIICATCVEAIDKKLIPLIDLGKLQLLKTKIRNNSTTWSPRSSSISSSSESSISSGEWSNYGGLTLTR